MRESFSILNWWKHPRYLYTIDHTQYKSNIKLKVFFIRLSSVLKLLKKVIRYNYERELFIYDNFKQPFLNFKCKIFNHKYTFNEISYTYKCFRCGKEITIENYNKYIRIKKIKSLF